jgi:hypothetical protein
MLAMAHIANRYFASAVETADWVADLNGDSAVLSICKALHCVDAHTLSDSKFISNSALDRGGAFSRGDLRNHAQIGSKGIIPCSPEQNS